MPPTTKTSEELGKDQDWDGDGIYISGTGSLDGSSTKTGSGGADNPGVWSWGEMDFLKQPVPESRNKAWENTSGRYAAQIALAGPQNAPPQMQSYTNNPYYLRALNQQLGFDPQAMQSLRSGIDTMAGQAYERGLSPLKRQQAMLGATGTGADMVANNALAAQISDQAMQQRQALDLANMQQIERDLTGAAGLAQQGITTNMAQSQFASQQAAALQSLASEQWANIVASGKVSGDASGIYEAAFMQALPYLTDGDPANDAMGFQFISQMLGTLGLQADERAYIMRQIMDSIGGWNNAPGYNVLG